MNSSCPGAIYLRLSREDGSEESLSISNQRRLLLSYAARNGFSIVREFADDGYSGTGFDRPGFRAMIRAVEDGEIGLILTKDLSRLGRDYIRTGEYTELFFPAHRVRFIAVGDGYDSAVSSPDLIPFRNVVNEMYARDISRKIRLALQTRMEQGSFIGSAPPYGYEVLVSPDGVRYLSPDPGSAPTVRKLFDRAAAGIRPSQLADSLNETSVPCPSLYRLLKKGIPPSPDLLSRKWTANTIVKLLRNPVYTGNLVQGKTKKLSFKSSLSLTVPEAERILVPHTHVPLADLPLFLACGAQLDARICRKR